jgi:hypothetical protein
MALKDDPVASGRLLASLFQGVEPRLWTDLTDTGAVPAGAETAARAEWECLALDACLRGLVAAGGFGERTVEAVDEFHAAVLAGWAGEAGAGDLDERRSRLTARYEEYGRIARELESKGAARVSAMLGATAAAHACSPGAPPESLAALLAAMHEALVEGAMAALRLPDPAE